MLRLAKLGSFGLIATVAAVGFGEDPPAQPPAVAENEDPSVISEPSISCPGLQLPNSVFLAPNGDTMAIRSGSWKTKDGAILATYEQDLVAFNYETLFVKVNSEQLGVVTRYDGHELNNAQNLNVNPTDIPIELAPNAETMKKQKETQVFKYLEFHTNRSWGCRVYGEFDINLNYNWSLCLK